MQMKKRGQYVSFSTKCHTMSGGQTSKISNNVFTRL